MTTTRPPRECQGGNSMLLALIVMSALATLGSLTVVSVQSSLKTATNERSQAVARYAAESGAAMAMDFLRANPANWTSYFDPASIPVAPSPAFPSNRALPGTAGNPFSADQNAWFELQFRNNRSDPGFLPPDPDGSNPSGNTDTDNQVIIRSTGHGPQGAVAIVEWEVKLSATSPFPMILIGWHVVL